MSAYLPEFNPNRYGRIVPLSEKLQRRLRETQRKCERLLAAHRADVFHNEVAEYRLRHDGIKPELVRYIAGIGESVR